MRKKKTQFNYSPFIYIFLILSLCLNLYLLISPGGRSRVDQVLGWQQLKEIREPGTYGPLDMEVVEGPLMITAPGVTLQNTRVTDDLILTAAIGDGCVDLVRVVVEDTVMVQGGGEDTVVFEDATINHLVINREGGKVRVVLKGNTVVKKITILGESSLSASALSGEGRVGEIYIETAAEIELEGDFETVCVTEPEARVTFLAGLVKSLCTGKEAEDALIDLKDGVSIESLLPGAPLELSGEGTILEITINSPGLCKISGNVEKISAAGLGIFLEFAAGNMDALFVDPSEGTVMIHLPEGAAAEYMEFNGAGEVTGSGSIGHVKINVSGVAIEQKPGKVELAGGIKAMVGGEEHPVEKPKTKATEKDSTAQKPKKEEPAPSPGTPAAPQEPPKDPKPVDPVDPLISFQSLGPEDGAPVLPGERLVIVIIHEPEKHSVFIKGHDEPLTYRPSSNVFRGVVPENLARRENVIIK